MKTEVFAAIRKTADDEHEWIDTNTVTYLHDLSCILATETDKKLPNYAKDNPVIRIARFRLEEMKEASE